MLETLILVHGLLYRYINYFRFSNLGNTCYMNAILQSLFSLPSFSNDMLRQSIPWKKVPINALLRYYPRLETWIEWTLIHGVPLIVRLIANSTNSWICFLPHMLKSWKAFDIIIWYHHCQQAFCSPTGQERCRLSRDKKGPLKKSEECHLLHSWAFFWKHAECKVFL